MNQGSTQYRKIMVTLDGSTFSDQALPHAAELAERYGAHLVLFRAVADAARLGELLDETRNLVNIDERERRMIDEAMADLETVRQDLQHRGISARVTVKVGDPASLIVDYAGEQDIDLIVMSTHGRSGLARWVFGSVAEKVLRSAPCPVHLVRSALK